MSIGSSHTLEDPDGAESGGGVEATACHGKLQKVIAKYTSQEITFVNF